MRRPHLPPSSRPNSKGSDPPHSHHLGARRAGGPLFLSQAACEARMESEAAGIARRLGRQAEAVCRHYLSNGRRRGDYWIVGDIDNTPGRSLYVRLTGPATPDPVPPANGPMQPPAITAICSISSPPLCTSLRRAMCSTRRAGSLACQIPTRCRDDPPPAPVRPRRHGGCSPWAGRSQARWRGPTCSGAASSACATSPLSVSIRGATTGATIICPTSRPRSGRRCLPG